MKSTLDEKITGFDFLPDKSNYDIEIYEKKIDDDLYCLLKLNFRIKKELIVHFEMIGNLRGVYPQAGGTFEENFNLIESRENLVIRTYKEYLNSRPL